MVLLCRFADNVRHRREGILVLSGGLLIHNLRDFASFSESTANSVVKEFDQAILSAVSVTDVSASLSLERAAKCLTDDGSLTSACREEASYAGAHEAQGLPRGAPTRRSLYSAVHRSGGRRGRRERESPLCHLRGTNLRFRSVNVV